MFVIIEKGEEFPVAPDTALVEGRVIHAAFAEGLLEFFGVERVVVDGFKQSAAIGAVVEDFGDGEAAGAVLIKAG